MAENTSKRLNIRTLIRRGDADTINNEVLLDGELGYDKTNKILKIGNGSSSWNELPAISVSSPAATPSSGIEVLYNNKKYQMIFRIENNHLVQILEEKE